MADKTYVTKGYSTYTYIPDLEDGYDRRPVNPINEYALETKTTERVHGPPVMYTDYGLNYENSSPPIFNNEGNWTMKTSTISSANEYYVKSPMDGYYSDETRPGPLGFTGHVRNGNINGQNKSWESAGTPMTNHHPLTTSTDSTKESLGYEKRYARPVFVAKPIDIREKRHWWL